MRYEVTWVCAECGRDNARELERVEAAFICGKPFREACHACGSRKYSSAGFPLPDIDADLLEVWFETGQRFLDQDEHLIIAETPLAELQAFLAKEDGSGNRRLALGESLAAKLYDEEFDRKDERDWCIDWLQLFPEAWRRQASEYIVEGVDKKIAAEAKRQSLERES